MVSPMSSNRSAPAAIETRHPMTTTKNAQMPFTAADQSAQVLHLSARDSASAVIPFADNLDHLQALEKEACLILIRAMLRRTGAEVIPGSDRARAFSLAGLAPEDLAADRLEQLLLSHVQRTRLREEASIRAGIRLTLPCFCDTYSLESFERTMVLLLFMHTTSRGFNEMFYLCGFEKERSTWNEGMKIGSLLSIICSNYREQVDRRAGFSVDAPLISQEIVLFRNTLDETSNILDETVCLHERFVRFILDDNNLYSTMFRFIRRERSSISLDQVVMAEEMKREVVTHVGNYLKRRERGTRSILDDFYGYGTGLTLLFRGASGTGKTMLAKALASHFGRQLFSLKLEDMDDMPGSYEDILGTLFREASLHGGIVFFDESDDIFQNDSRASRALLIEIEKARCVVILATNKPVELDPAMERRISMKVTFAIPGPELRFRMWQALIPPGVRLAADVDLHRCAERYHFTGGLIKNTIFMAINTAMAGDEEREAVISRELLDQAALLQSSPLADMSGLCRTYEPMVTLGEIPVRLRQKEQLGNIAKAYRHVKEEGLGLAILFSAGDIATGIHAVQALANACGLKVREFDFDRAVSLAEESKAIDPVTQKKVSPMRYAFADHAGDASLILFVDHNGEMERLLSDNPDTARNIILTELTGQLRAHRGLFCLVSRKLGKARLPAVFSLRFDLEYPPEEVQMRRWEDHLGHAAAVDADLVSLVEQHPMHVAEIDFIARQARIHAIIHGRSNRPTTADIVETIERHQGKRYQPVLFGENRRLETE